MPFFAFAFPTAQDHEDVVLVHAEMSGRSPAELDVFGVVGAAAAMGRIAAACTLWHMVEWIAAASAAATVYLEALGNCCQVSESPFTVVFARGLAVASTVLGLVSSPQDGQVDLQGQPWKSLPIKEECDLEVTRKLNSILPKSWLELEKQSLPVFVRTLSGTVSIHCTSDMLVSEFALLIEKKTRVPSSLTYLTFHGRHLHDGELMSSTGIKRDDLVSVKGIEGRCTEESTASSVV